MHSKITKGKGKIQSHLDIGKSNQNIIQVVGGIYKVQDEVKEKVNLTLENNIANMK